MRRINTIKRSRSLTLLFVLMCPTPPAFAASAAQTPNSFIATCDNMIGPRVDTGARLSCFQAQAIIEAAEINDKGARYAGDKTFSAALIALLGSLILAFAAFGQSRYASWLEREDRKARYRNAFSAEISSILTYLQDIGVVGSLREQAREERRRPFHPGEPNYWLRAYYASPESVGLFTKEVSRELVWFYARIFAQFGRIIYLHNLGYEGTISVGMPAINKIQVEIADTLDDLDRRGRILVTNLGGKMDNPSHDAARTPLLSDNSPIG